MHFGLNVVFVVAIVTSVDAAGVGGSCSTSLACTVSNSVCSFLFTKSSCTRGACACKEGYSGNTCVATRPLVGYSGKCRSRDDCEFDLTCTDRVCQCATTTYTYKTVLGECISPTKRALGEVCSNTSECYNFGGATNGMRCQTVGSVKQCACASGYTNSVGLCLLPYYGQPCTSRVGCRKRTVKFANSDSSRQTEVCPANGGTCVCPATTDTVPITYAGTTYVVCLQKTTAVLLGDGASCTASNQCDSRICSTCMDGTFTTRCVRPGKGGSEVIAHNTWGLLVMTVVTLIML